MRQPPRRRHLLAAATATAMATTLPARWASGASRTVTDMAGRRVALPPRIERIVTLGSLPVLNSFVFTMGEGRRIVNGLADFARPHWRYQTVFAPQLAHRPTMQQPNREPNLEALLQAAPDVVLTMHREHVDRVAALGLPTAFLAWREPEDVLACMALLGQVFDQPAVAAAYTQWFQATLARVAQGLRGLAERERPRVLFLQPDNLTQPRLIAEWWIPAGGGISVTADGRRTESRSFTLEQVLAWDPDRLIVASPQAVATVQQHPQLARLRAVRAGRVHLVPVGAHSWSHRTAEQPLTVLWAARTFHPARFAALDLAAEAGGFYERFFGLRPSAAELAEMLSGTL